MIGVTHTQAIYHLADVEHVGPVPCGPDCALQSLSAEERKEVHEYVDWVRSLEGPEGWPRRQQFAREQLARQGE
jgi:hypothetical protein